MHKRGHGHIYDSITDTIGNTPMVHIKRLSKLMGVSAHLYAKLEFLNPMSSVKDRIGVAMIDAAEKAGHITPEITTLIEPSSGNTGIALAFVAAARGYRLIIVMPETMSQERWKMLKLLGADIELTKSEDGMTGALEHTRKLLKKIPNSFTLEQFSNPANPEIHRQTTAEEIWNDTQGDVDALVIGTGTGGTLSGIGSVLKERNPNFYIVAVEPEDSAVLSGSHIGPHKIDGIGPGFIPHNLDMSLVNEVLTIGNETAFESARQMAKIEGIPCGISSGAAVAAAIEIAQRQEMADKKIVIILPSFAERYLSTPLFEGL